MHPLPILDIPPEKSHFSACNLAAHSSVAHRPFKALPSSKLLLEYGLPSHLPATRASRSLAIGCSSKHSDGCTYQGIAQPVGKYLYLLGGCDGDLRPLSTVERFDPASGVWEAVRPIQIARRGCTATVAKGRIYISGLKGLLCAAS